MESIISQRHNDVVAVTEQATYWKHPSSTARCAVIKMANVLLKRVFMNINNPKINYAFSAEDVGLSAEYGYNALYDTTNMIDTLFFFTLYYTFRVNGSTGSNSTYVQVISKTEWYHFTWDAFYNPNGLSSVEKSNGKFKILIRSGAINYAIFMYT